MLTWHLGQLPCSQLGTAAVHTFKGDLDCHPLLQRFQVRLDVDKGGEARLEVWSFRVYIYRQVDSRNKVAEGLISFLKKKARNSELALHFCIECLLRSEPL